MLFYVHAQMNDTDVVIHTVHAATWIEADRQISDTLDEGQYICGVFNTAGVDLLEQSYQDYCDEQEAAWERSRECTW